MDPPPAPVNSEDLGGNFLYDEGHWDGDNLNIKGIEEEKGFNYLLKEHHEKVANAMRQLIYGDFNFIEHLKALREIFTSQPILLFFIWNFARAFDKGITLPDVYVTRFVEFLLSSDQSNDLPFGLVIGRDRQGQNVTVISELRRILNYYEPHITKPNDLQQLKYSLGIFPRLRARPQILRPPPPAQGPGPSNRKRPRCVEVPTGLPESNEEPPPERPCDVGYSAVPTALRLLQETGLSIQDIEEEGNDVIRLIKEVELNRPGAKESLSNLLRVDHPCDYIEAILDQIPDFKRRLVILRICQCRTPMNGVTTSVTLEGKRPSNILEHDLEGILKRAGFPHIFCHNCQQQPKNKLASLEESHTNETDYILLRLPVFEGKFIQNCAIGQGIPDFDIPISFANSGWSLRAMALHMQSADPRYFTCVLRYPPSHLYYEQEIHQALPPELPVAKRATLWLFKRVPIDRCFIPVQK